MHIAPTSLPRYRDYVRQTMATRIPDILQKASGDLDGAPARDMKALRVAVAEDAPMLMDLGEWPFPGWETLPDRVNGLRPSEAAFFDFEYWLYFRILHAVGFAETRFDPFRAVKHRDLTRHIEWADEAIQTTRNFAAALELALNANAHDLSQVSGPSASHLVGRGALAVPPASLRRLNLIADNFGGEFVADLVLATIAAEMGMEVAVHVKHLPMFVSDATTDDVAILLDRMRSGSDFAVRLRRQIDRGNLRITSNPFWSAPLFMDRAPVDELKPGEGTLTVLKGDLNFRRAIGDAEVPVRTPFGELPVLPSVPMLALRSIKSYCAAGMLEWPAGMPEEAFPTDGTIVAPQQIPGRATASA